MAQVAPVVQVAPSSTHYETVFILRSNTADSEITSIMQKVEDVIGKFNGSIIEKDDWGDGDLAYPIDKNKRGRTMVINFKGERGVVEEIDRHFRILPQIIRHLVTVCPAGYLYAQAKKQASASQEEFKKRAEAREAKKRHYGGASHATTSNTIGYNSQKNEKTES